MLVIFAFFSKIRTWEPGPVLGKLDINRSLVWDQYSGTWTRTQELWIWPVLVTRLCTQVPEYNTFYKGKKEVGPISMGHTVALINELYFSITCRTCIQWLCLQLSSALGSQIFGFRTLNIPWPLGGAIKVVVRYFLIEKSSLLYTIIEYIIDSRIKKIPRLAQ